MAAVPGTALTLEFKTRHPLTLNLTDASAVAIVVKDPARSTRILYDVANLAHVSTGYYRYYFTIPDDVVEGDWYASISVTVGTIPSVRNVHFEVEEV